MPAMPDILFRTAVPPRPVECFELSHPAVPGALEGLTILHVSDLHVRRNLLATERYRGILRALEATPADVIVLTGDLMDEPGHERGALETLRAMAAMFRARVGVFSVFGNHDTPEFRRACAREIPSIRYIGGEVVDVPIGGVGGAVLRLVGLDWPEDVMGVMLGKDGCRGGVALDSATSGAPGVADSKQSTTAPERDSLTIALAHHPTSLIGVADAGIPIMMAGHTHAGQVRLHKRLSPHTSSDLPVHLASGILRLRETVCCISRGLGDGVVEGLRFNCPRQMPLYTLRRGPMAGIASETVTQAMAW